MSSASDTDIGTQVRRHCGMLPILVLISGGLFYGIYLELIGYEMDEMSTMQAQGQKLNRRPAPRVQMSI
jgi:hypothetical protein